MRIETTNVPSATWDQIPGAKGYMVEVTDLLGVPIVGPLKVSINSANFVTLPRHRGQTFQDGEYLISIQGVSEAGTLIGDDPYLDSFVFKCVDQPAESEKVPEASEVVTTLRLASLFEKQLATVPAVSTPENGGHGVNGNGDRLSLWQLGRRSIRALVEKTKLKLWPKRNGHNDNQPTTTTEDEIMKAKTKPTQTANMPTVTFPSTSISIMPMSGVDAYKIEFLENAKIVGELTIDSMGDTAKTVKENFLCEVKFAPDHPKNDAGLSYVFNASAIKGGKLFGVPAVFAFSGEQIFTGLAKASEKVAALAEKPADKATKPTPAAAEASQTPASAKPAAPNTAPAAEKPLSVEMLKELARILTGIQTWLGKVRQVKQANNVGLKFLKQTSYVLNCIDEDIAKVEESCNKDNPKLLEVKQQAATLETELKELGQAYRDRIAAQQATAPTAQTQVPPVVTPPAQAVPPVQSAPPTPPRAPQVPVTTRTPIPPRPPFNWFKWIGIGFAASMALVIMLVLGIVAIAVGWKLMGHRNNEDGLHRRPITPSSLVVPTNVVVAAIPQVPTNATSGGVTTVIETREGGKVNTTVTNSSGFIANAPFIGSSNTVTIIQVGGSWNGSGMSSWPNNAQPTKTRKLELTRALLPGESEDFVVTINPNEDWEITYPSGPYWVELHVTSPSPNVFGGLVSTPPSLYEATLDGNVLEAFDGVRHYSQVLRLKSRGIKIVLGLRCTRK